MSSWFLSEACSNRALSKCIKGECREENRRSGLNVSMPDASGCVGGRLVSSLYRKRNSRTQRQFISQSQAPRRDAWVLFDDLGKCRSANANVKIRFRQLC